MNYDFKHRNNKDDSLKQTGKQKHEEWAETEHSVWDLLTSNLTE